jgi:FADH2 O2-dependent halogenase
MGERTPGQLAERRPQHVDVAVLGSHLTTGLLASILGRHGVRVALVPSRTDALTLAGETTVPYTAELFFLLGSRFDVPEIQAMGRYSELPASIRATSGGKQNLGFLYHRAGQRQRPAEALQFVVPSEHAEWHLHRPEVDAYAAELARGYGAAVFSSPARPGGVQAGPDDVCVDLEDGTRIRAEFLVDGSDDPRLLPSGVAAADNARPRHRARLLSAVLAGVQPAESYLPPQRCGPGAGPWSAGTLTHVFDGGWLQLVGYGPDRATCGVTVSLDPGRHPVSAETPAAEFRRLTGCFPDIERAFGAATVVRPWQRLQDWPSAVACCSGPRWFLFDRAAGRHDAVLSGDVTVSLEVLHATAGALLDVARSGNWAGGELNRVGSFQLSLFGFQDRLVCAARTATGDFRLWNAFLRVWLLWSILSALSVQRARLDATAGTRPDGWSGVGRLENGQFWYEVPRGLPQFVDDALAELENVRQGGPAGGAAERILARLRTEPFIPPLFDFGDPRARLYVFSPQRRQLMQAWVETVAPADFRRLLTEENATGVPKPAHG